MAHVHIVNPADRIQFALPPGEATALQQDLARKLTPEEIRAVEEVFAHDHNPEAQAVAGLLGLWSGTLLLHDVARETFDGPAEEEEKDPNKPKPRPGTHP
jgi:hypothetical protein